MVSQPKGQEKTNKKKVLILCFHNSARSQMAEGLLRAICGNKYEVYSAGVEVTYVDPRAVKVMSEIGIDIFGQHSKRMDEYRGILSDLAVTVCDKAKEACPICGISLKAPDTAHQRPKRLFTRLSMIRLLLKVQRKSSLTSSGK